MRELAAREQQESCNERDHLEALRLLRHYPGDSELMFLNKGFPHLFASPDEVLLTLKRHVD